MQHKTNDFNNLETMILEEINKFLREHDIFYTKDWSGYWKTKNYNELENQINIVAIQNNIITPIAIRKNTKSEWQLIC